MDRESWISHMIIPCKGMDRCEYYKPGEKNHPQEHIISKVICQNGSNSSKVSSNQKFLRSGKFLDNLAPVPIDSKLDPPQLSVCFNCWYPNHITRECFSKKRYTYCSNCGRRNVQVEDCPRCCKAYCEYIEEEEHIRAKIELYGDEPTCPGISSNFYTAEEDHELKPAKNEKSLQTASFGKEGEFRSDSFFENKTEHQIFSSSSHIDTNKYQQSFGSTGSNACSLSKLNTANQCEIKSFDDPEHKQVNFNVNSVPSKLVDDEEEDYDNIVVDEDEKSVMPSEIGDMVSRFMDLLHAIKHLPIKAQNVAVTCFVNAQKKQNQT